MRKILLSLFTLGMLSFSMSAANDYGIPENIQDGNILHCFDWTFTDIQKELPNIAAAGFGAVQVSPVQGNCNSNAEWFYAYMPYDFKFKANGNGSSAQLQTLCSEAGKYGIKIIVDVVANHVNVAQGYRDPWWDSNGRERNNGGINYGDRNSITHGNLGGYHDVNSESAEVQQRARAFVEELKGLGVKGIRWDAAKHIGLPSEGCNFWSEVTKVSGMYHYGEILDSPGGNNANALMKEYTKYMSVTDNGYSKQCRENDGVPGSYGGWAAGTISDSNVVYWPESHDEYSNGGEYGSSTVGVSQATLDRAYAIEACRRGATALYFSRPSATTKTTIKMGVKGSTAFTAKHIAEVNKFRNIMVGRADYYSSSGSAASVTRQGGGAVIVKKGGSGSVSVPNGGGYVPAGTYKDRVDGGMFTVTATTISGNVGSSGIAVIYGEDLGEYDPDLGNSGNGGNGGNSGNDNNGGNTGGSFTIYFDNSNSNWPTPYIHYWGNTESTWPGVAMNKVSGNVWSYTVPAGTTGCLFNAGDGDATKTSDFTAKANHIYTTSGDQGVYDGAGGNGENQGGNSGGDFNIYFDNSNSNWPTPYIHYWGNTESTWPGVAMSKVSGNVWSYTVPAGTTGCLFNAGDGDPTKTSDFTAIANHIYTTSGDQGVYSGASQGGNGGSQGGGTNPTGNMYILGDLVETNGWRPNMGVLMDKEGSYFVKRNFALQPAFGDETTSYFSFTTYITNLPFGDDEASQKAAWNDVNSNATRYGALVEGQNAPLNLNELTYMYSAQGDVPAFAVAPGSYDVVMDPVNLTVTLYVGGTAPDMTGGNQGGNDNENQGGNENDNQNGYLPDGPAPEGELYILGDLVETNGWRPNMGVLMDKEGSCFVKRNFALQPAFGDETTSYFSFTTYITNLPFGEDEASQKAAWNDVNANATRYGALVEGQNAPLNLNEPTVMYSAQGDVPAFAVAPGSYDVVVNPQNWTVTLYRSGQAPAGVEEIFEPSSYSITLAPGALVLNGLNGEFVIVAGIDGKLYYNNSSYGTVDLSLNRGIYIVKVAGQSTKVVIR